MDTWYGHSYDGINLWWSIDGVNEDNTIILYPEMFGRALKYDPVSMYIAPGVSLPRPHKIAMAPEQPRPNHIVRGGSWTNRGADCRSARRFFYDEGFRSDQVGFRVVCEP